MPGKSAEDVQRKSFTKWLNSQIAQGGHGGAVEPVQNLEEDLRNGITLIHLLACTTGQKMPKYDKKCKMEVQMISNCGIALDMVKEAKIKLLGVGSQDIVAGQTKNILALLWAIIYAQQIGSIQGEDSKSSGKEGLLLWVRRATAGYDGVPSVANFKSHWSDGLVLAALIDRHRPDVISFAEMQGLSPSQRLERCIAAASQKLGVPELIDAADMEQALDEKSTMCYISEFFKIFSRMQSADQGRKRLQHFFSTQKAIDTLAWDFEAKATEVLSFVDEHLARIAALKPTEGLVPAKRAMDSANQFRKGDLVAMRQMKGSLEGTLGSLQTALSCHGRPPYQPSETMAIPRIDGRWNELEDAAAEHTKAVRDAYRAAREKVSARCVELANSLYDELSRLQKELRGTKGEDPEKLLAALEPLETAAAGLRDNLAEAQGLFKELDDAQVTLEDIAGLEHSIEDIEHAHRTLLTALDRKRKFLEQQIEQKKGGAVSEKKQSEIRETFEYFDRNKSGTLTRDEFLGALKGLGRDMSDEEGAALFKKHKQSGAPEMTVDEFVQVMTQLEQQTSSSPGEILESLACLQSGGESKGPVTKEMLAEACGAEAAEYFARQVPPGPDGSYDFSGYLKRVFSTTAAPSECPGMSPYTSGRRRGKSVRSEAVGVSFAAVDPPSDDEGAGAAPPAGRSMPPPPAAAGDEEEEDS